MGNKFNIILNIIFKSTKVRFYGHFAERFCGYMVVVRKLKGS
jgi:hypothetical protein